ncbi:MAG: ribonuclease P protein component [bacterium]|nr:ribonuclease P protein component [bacterium]
MIPIISKEYHIKKSQEIEKIIKNKKSVGNKYFVIYSMDNIETNHYRFSISIGKKYGIAVKRNLMKRRIREIIKNNMKLIKNKDYVIVVKPTSKDLNFIDIEKNIIYLLKKEESK